MSLKGSQAERERVICINLLWMGSIKGLTQAPIPVATHPVQLIGLIGRGRGRRATESTI